MLHGWNPHKPWPIAHAPGGGRKNPGYSVSLREDFSYIGENIPIHPQKDMILQWILQQILCTPQKFKVWLPRFPYSFVTFYYPASSLVHSSPLSKWSPSCHNLAGPTGDIMGTHHLEMVLNSTLHWHVSQENIRLDIFHELMVVQ